MGEVHMRATRKCWKHGNYNRAPLWLLPHTAASPHKPSSSLPQSEPLTWFWLEQLVGPEALLSLLCCFFLPSPSSVCFPEITKATSAQYWLTPSEYIIVGK